MTGDLDAILASIDGALADDDLPDAMRWSPEPETVDAPAPFDGSLVRQPPQRYEAIRPTLSVECAELRHSACDGCGLCTCHDRRPPIVILDDPLPPGGPLPRIELPHLRRLTLPEANAWALQAERSPEEYEEALRQLRDAYAPAAEALGRMVEEFGKIARDAGLRLAELIDAIGKLPTLPDDRPVPPPRRLRDEDPRLYALQLRQARGTGPDRPSGERAHRPRVHR